MKKVLFFFMMCVFLMSCGHHRDGSSVWAGGLWILPVLGFAATAWSYYRMSRSLKSGSTQQIPGQGTVSYKENVKFYQVASFWFGSAFLVATIAIIWGVNYWKG